MQYIYMYMYILRYVGINRIVHVLNDIVGTDYCKKKIDIKVKNCTKEIHRFLFVNFIFEQPYLCD